MTTDYLCNNLAPNSQILGLVYSVLKGVVVLSDHQEEHQIFNTFLAVRRLRLKTKGLPWCLKLICSYKSVNRQKVKVFIGVLKGNT